MPEMIKWDPSLETGVRAVDKQHKEFFNLVNMLLNNSLSRKNSSTVVKAFDFLNDYVIYHFKAEESLMCDYKYDKYKEHADNHRYFANEMKKLHLQVKGKQYEEVSMRVNYLTVNWFVNHIRTHDRLLAKFLTEKAKVNKGLFNRLLELASSVFRHSDSSGISANAKNKKLKVIGRREKGNSNQ